MDLSRGRLVIADDYIGAAVAAPADGDEALPIAVVLDHGVAILALILIRVSGRVDSSGYSSPSLVLICALLIAFAQMARTAREGLITPLQLLQLLINMQMLLAAHRRRYLVVLRHEGRVAAGALDGGLRREKHSVRRWCKLVDLNRVLVLMMRIVAHHLGSIQLLWLWLRSEEGWG